MQIKREVLQALFILSISVWYVSGQACNVCQSNSAACINETSFYLCYGGTVPIKDQMFHCADGLICSNLPNICFQSNGASASCGDTSSCGLCNENQVFACTSRNTFAFCFGATKPTDVTGSCPTGRICDASTQNICVTEVQSTSIICNLDSPGATNFADNATTFWN
ncbi:uncharacterized protein LOC126762485 [Bactrocera neohumeralis]|uniref:uncharacterized protein LOC126762485 n=1 Tax=Bactrocera neohumeralis TaxID=98809 RepID=UPI0021663137|nr:uncharacterized protein LOC126762485 [Bactrocera neohumeralis]